jgi:hypothetical protein
VAPESVVLKRPPLSLAAIATAVFSGLTSTATVRPPHLMLGWNSVTEGEPAHADTPRLIARTLKDIAHNNLHRFMPITFPPLCGEALDSREQGQEAHHGIDRKPRCGVTACVRAYWIGNGVKSLHAPTAQRYTTVAHDALVCGTSEPAFDPPNG